MDNVIDFADRRKKFIRPKEPRLCAAEDAYQHFIDGMDKLDLLEEMVRFQEWRSKEGQLTPEMMVKGRILFKALEESAETPELKLLTRSYRRHLDYELDSYLQAGKS